MRRPGHLWVVGVVALVLACMLPVLPAHAAWETLKILGNQKKEFNPGAPMWLTGHSWWGPISNCKNKVAIYLIDSAGRKKKMGQIGAPPEGLGLLGRDVQNVWDIEGLVHEPMTGIRAGKAQLLAVQRVKFRIPGLPCLQFARKQSRISGLRILGVEGNDPPAVTGLAAPDFRQGRPGAISWSQSEAGRATVKVAYRFTPALPLDVATLVDEQRPGGANLIDWDAMAGGRALPAGRYRVTVQVRGADDASSDVVQRDFTVGFG